MQAKQAKQIFQLCAALVTGTLTTAAFAQSQPCSSLPPAERVFARAIGACSDPAPIVDVPSNATGIAVTNVVGLTFDEARSQLGRFTVRRSYRASAEAGGTVLSQQPAPPARLPAGAVVTVTLSDGSLRPRPNVPDSQVDGVRAPMTADRPAPPPSVAIDQTSAADASPAPPRVTTASRKSDQPRAAVVRAEPQVPNVVGLSIRDAQSRLARFRIERADQYSRAPAGQVIEQSPPAAARLAAGQPISIVVSRGPEPIVATELFDLPNVVDRSYPDAAGVLAEFKVDRVNVPNAAPSGTVVGQSPAAGTWVAPGSPVALHVSDGSLAAAAAVSSSAPAAAPVATDTASSPSVAGVENPTTPAGAEPDSTAEPAAPASAATAPVAPSDEEPVLRLANTELTIGTAIFLALFLIALLVRHWLARRHEAPLAKPETAPVAPTIAPTVAVADVAATAPEIRFAARFEQGDVSVKFSEAADAAETLEEYSSAQHE